MLLPLILASLSFGQETPSTGATPPITTDPAVWETPGRAIPFIELPRIDGRGDVDLADFIGKKVLLIQFASW